MKFFSASSRGGFSLAEMMVVLFMISVASAAFMPIMTKKTKSIPISPWKYVASGYGTNSDIFFGTGTQGVAIGTNSLTGNQGSRLLINTTTGSATTHIGFLKDNIKVGDLVYDLSGFIGLGNNIPHNYIGVDVQSNAVAIGNEMTLKKGNESVSLGYKALGSGVDSVSLGSNSLASGLSSLAIGPSSAVAGSCGVSIGIANASKGASGDNAVAIGKDAKASGSMSNAFGSSSSASGSSSIAIGQAQANGSSSLAIGSQANGSGAGSLAFGSSSDASGADSVAIGSSSTASAASSTAVGHLSWAKSANTTAMGSSSEASAQNTTALGSDASATKNDATAVGNGAQATVANNTALGSNSRASGSGSTAIGYNTVASGSGGIVLGTSSSATGTNSVAIGNSVTAGNCWDFVLGTSSHNVRIPGTLSIGGNNVINNSGTWKTTSDRRLKNVGGEFTGGLDQIRELKTYNFTYKSDKQNEPMVGVMAQDLQQVFPDAVTKTEKGYFMIRKEDMFYAMINSIKQLDKMVQNFAAELKTIVVKIQTIDDKISALIMVNQINSQKINVIYNEINALKLENKELKAEVLKLKAQ